jgi:hypothetical protein
VRDDFAATHARVGGHEDLRFGVVYAGGEIRSGEATEDDGVDRPETYAGEHDEDSFRHHRHIDDHPVSPADPEAPQSACQGVDLSVKLPVRIAPPFAGFGRDVDQGVLLAPLGEVPVNGVVAQVGLAPDKPPGERRIVKIQHPLRVLVPLYPLGLFHPESLTILQRSPVKRLVLLHAQPFLLPLSF